MYEDYHEPRTHSDSGGWFTGAVICIILFLIFILWPSDDSLKVKVEVPKVSNNQVRLEAFDEVSKSCLKNDGIKEVSLISSTIDMDIQIVCNDEMSKKIKNVPLH